MLPGPPKADSPAYCRLPVEANTHLLALSRGLPYRVTAKLGGNVGPNEETAGGECRYKVRPCGPTNRAAAAAGRRDRRARRWGERPPVLTRIHGARLDWRPRMAVTWSFKAAGLACATAQVWPASAS